MAKNRAVLTGDLVGSTQASPADTDRAMEALRTAAGGIERWVGSRTRFTRFRGDGWQILLDDPGFSLQTVVAILSHLTAADAGPETRIAIGFAPIDPIGTLDLSDASGEAVAGAVDAVREHDREAGPP